MSQEGHRIITALKDIWRQGAERQPHPLQVTAYLPSSTTKVIADYHPRLEGKGNQREIKERRGLLYVIPGGPWVGLVSICAVLCCDVRTYVCMYACACVSLLSYNDYDICFIVVLIVADDKLHNRLQLKKTK